MQKLIAPLGRIIVSIDTESKNKHKFANGQEIYLGRHFNNLNKRYTQPVNGTVISSEYIPEGSQVLVHHNACHDSHKIFNYQSLSGNEIADTTKYYSLPESQIFFYKEPNTTEWKATKGFATALRVFKPYEGIISGIEPTQLKDTLFVTSGDYKDKAVRTLKASDYELVYQDSTGTEARLIRFRETDIEERPCEVIAILHETTEKILNGEYQIGLSTTDCKTVERLQYEQKIYDDYDKMYGCDSLDEWIAEHDDGAAVEYREALAFLNEINDNAADSAADGVVCIADDYFEDYAKELAMDIGAIGKDMAWPLNHIDWEAAAEALQEDYTPVEWAGYTFYVK